jgi:hypothetical protein
MEAITKQCSKCGEVKCIDDFPKDKTKSSGYKYCCKKCFSLYLKSRIKNYRLKYLKTGQSKLNTKKWRLNNPDKTIESEIKDRLKKKGVPINQELIQCKLLIIKTKRLCKTLNNSEKCSVKTSSD